VRVANFAPIIATDVDLRCLIEPTTFPGGVAAGASARTLTPVIFCATKIKRRGRAFDLFEHSIRLCILLPKAMQLLSR